MLNYWWVSRPKRKLNSIPAVLACFATVALNCDWQGDIYTHMKFEEALEKAGLKRIGERRDQRGSGGRTYYAWLSSLGLIFIHEKTGQTKLTLAGEAILNGNNSVAVLRNQVLKYQFPSPFSLSLNNSRSRVHERFKIRPFRFLLKLLRDSAIDCKLMQDEIGRVIAVEATDESESVYNAVINRIVQYREKGVKSLSEDFIDQYAPSSNKVNVSHPFSHLDDLANTLINWLEYTQYISREDQFIRILPEKIGEIDAFLNVSSEMIGRPCDQEYFQRKFGLDLVHIKDNRNFLDTQTITSSIINEQIIKQAFISESLNRPIARIDADIISCISARTGIKPSQIDNTLNRLYPHGAIGSFMTEYFGMAFQGRDRASDFEKATAELFQRVFGFKTYHTGPIGLTPDVLLVSESSGYQAIIDNKAYSTYSISNDHHNRMVHNYIRNISSYAEEDLPLAYFSYIAGGFCSYIDNQINKIIQETDVCGSAISVTNIIRLVELHQNEPYTHDQLMRLFSTGRQILVTDL